MHGLRALALLGTLFLSPAAAGDIAVAVAANFQSTLERLGALWERKSGDRLALIPGATGALHAQIVNGLPVEIFFAADAARPEALETAGLTQARRLYAIGKLVLVDRSGATGPVPARIAGTDRTVAIAKPDTAPYGAAAREVLIGARGAAGWEANVVMGESIGQTFAFVATGNAPLAFVARSQVSTLGFDASVTEVPAALHSPIRQEAVLLNGASPQAAAFFDWLATPEARAIIEADGYRSE